MINVNQMTAAFAKMPDAALKQYAMMHKNDPYTMSLAMSESNRRKQIRDSAQGQAAQQPTVVDQGIEQMDAPKQMAQALPENTGIGTLPQQPMQMAEGGIVAFAEGGKASWEYELDALVNPESAEQRPGNMSAWEAAKRAFLYSSDLEAQRAQRPVTPDALAAQSAMQAGGGRGTMQNDPRLAPGFSPTPEFVKTPTADKGGLKDLAAAAPTGAPRAAAGATDYASQYKALRGSMKDTDPYAAETSEIGEMGVKAARERKAEREADIAKFDKAYEGREGRLDKREAEIGKQKDTTTGLAFLNAGLAIMSTPGGLATAIGKGARVGTEQFAAGLDKIRAAQERLDDARDKAEDTKLRRDEMSAKEIRDANSAISSAQIDAKKLGIQGLRDAGAKNDRIAGSIFDATAKQAQERESMASRERVAGITAAPGLARNKILEASQGDQAKARTAYGALQTKVMSELAKDPTYALATPAEKSQMSATRLRDALMNNPFLSQYAAGIGFGGTASGTVRELDED